MDLRRNLKMVVAYEGTRFAGFQRQTNGLSTIQGELETAIFKITGETVNLTGAGRTDAGVHAKGQVVNFYSTTQIGEAKLLSALNAVLPKDIAIQSISEVPQDFHSRYSAIGKIYSYHIYQNEIRPLFNRNWVYHYRYPLKLDAMQDAVRFLEGTHDFASFQAAGSAVKTTVRTVQMCDLMQDGPEIIMKIKADGFLYHMVRNIVGTLLWVGSGKITPARFKVILEAADRKMAGPTAPACGLCLDEVIY